MYSKYISTMFFFVFLWTFFYCYYFVIALDPCADRAYDLLVMWSNDNFPVAVFRT